MQTIEQVKEKLLQLYNSAKKIEIEGKGGGWVDLAAFGWLVNRAKINYKGNGKGKLSLFLLSTGLFEIITVKNKFIKAKKSAESSIAKDDDKAFTDIPEAMEQQSVENNPVKQPTIFEEEEHEYTARALSLETHEISTMPSKIDDAKLQLFEKLKEAKQKDWETFSKPDYIGIWKSIIEKYPETAHFIYELIQNADDAHATEAAIVLYKDKLVFKHNGKRQFSLTDADSHEDTMGDINSITSVACSTKKDEEQTIGKFGVGFKSVFQYTESPSIYDDTFWFKIENYIIPTILKSDHELRYEGETLFEIPFKNPEKAYREIHLRLMNLRMPVLFLPHVQRIVWKVDGESCLHEYSKEILQSNTRHGISYDFCRINDFQKKHFLYLFKRVCNTSQGSFPISVGYYLDKKDGSLITNSKSSVYCFFPTSEKFEGCFVCHAPFLLTDNRDSIKTFEEVNTEFLHGISQLAADALICLKDIGINRSPRYIEFEDSNSRNLSGSFDLLLINDNIFHILNIHSTDDRNIYLKNCYLDVIKKEELILTRSKKYVNRDRALVTTADLESLLNSHQINTLYHSDNYDFVYLKQYRSDLRDLAESIGIATFDNEKLAEKLSKSFMQEQKPEWVKRLLVYVEEKARNLWVLKDDSPRICQSPHTYTGWGGYSRTTYPGKDSWSDLKFRFAPIAKTSKGDWVSPYSLFKEEANVILPYTGFEDVDSKIFGVILDQELFNQHKDFFNKLGLKRPSPLDYIEKVILPNYENYQTPDDEILLKDFTNIYIIIKNSRNHDNIIKLLKDKWKVKCINIAYREIRYIKDTALPNNDFIEFNGKSNVFKYVDCQYYAERTDIPFDDVLSFFKTYFNVPDKPQIKEVVCYAEDRSYTYSGKTYSYKNLPQCAVDYLSSRTFSLAATNRPKYKDYIMEGYDIHNRSNNWSHILWSYVLGCDIAQYSKATLTYYRYKAKTPDWKEFESTYLLNLKNDKWICKEDGTFCSPGEITTEEFHNLGYERNDSLEEVLGFWDFIKGDIEEKERIAKIAAEEEERNTLLQKAIEMGLDINGLLRNAVSNYSEDKNLYTVLVTESNRDAINTIVENLNNEEINQLAATISSGNYSSLRQSPNIPEMIVNNIEPLADITEAVGEENLPIVAERVGEFMSWMLDEDEEKSPSMVRRVISYIGKKIYENYLINEGIEYEPLENDASDCDYSINDVKYVRVISTLKSIADNRIPVGLSAAQNAFLKQHPTKEIRIIRISFRDIWIIPQYTRIVELLGKEEAPEMNERLRSMCDDLAMNYWNGAEIEEFDNASPEYSIKIDRKN